MHQPPRGMVRCLSTSAFPYWNDSCVQLLFHANPYRREKLYRKGNHNKIKSKTLSPRRTAPRAEFGDGGATGDAPCMSRLARFFAGWVWVAFTIIFFAVKLF